MTYCDKFGFDLDRRQEFFSLLELSKHDQSIANEMHSLIVEPNVDRIVDEFYSFMQKQAEFVALITKRRVDIFHLKTSQKDYLLTLGLDFMSEEYFDKRLRIGIAHAWNNVPLCQYLGGYRLILQLLVSAVPRDRDKQDWYDEMLSFLFKIISLDMLLASETYHEAQLLALEENLTSLRHKENRLKQEVSTDELTKLASRAHAMDILSKQLEKSVDSNKPLSVIMADLDHFKKVNDTYGHQVGDQILLGVASRMKSCVRNIDIIGRYGGEEMIIVLPNADSNSAQHVAERIRNNIASSPFSIGGNKIDMTISEGIASLDSADDSPENLIKRADTALYTAKRAGRNCVVIEL